jgi:hypothetical protein
MAAAICSPFPTARLCLQHPLMLKNYDELADVSEVHQLKCSHGTRYQGEGHPFNVWGFMEDMT